MNYIRQEVAGMIKTIGTFLNTEHPGLTNVSDIFTVGISVISIVVAFMSYAYVKNHDRQIAKFEQANEISSWVVHDSKGGVQMVENSPLMKVSVNNGSNQPIYDVVLTSGTYQGAGADYLGGTNNTVCVGTVPPGRFTTYVPYPGERMHVRLNRLLPFETIRVTTGFATPKAFFLKSKRIRMNISN